LMKAVSRTRATIANLIFYYTSLLLAITGIILVPVYLRFIDIKLYGAWLASGNIIGWLSMLDPGLNELLRQQVAKCYGEKNWTKLGQSIGTGWVVITGLSVLAVLIGLLISQVAPGLFSLETEHSKKLELSIFLASIGLALTFFGGSPGSVQQGLQRSERYLAVYLFGWACGIVATVIFLFKGFGLVAIPLGSVINGVLSSLGSSLDVIYLTKKKMSVSIGWCTQYFREIKGLIGATFLKQVGRILANSCDAFLVAIFFGVEVVPIVVFTSRLWQMAVGFGQRISVAFVPGLAHLWGEGRTDRAAEIGVKVLKVTVWFVAFEVAALLFLNKAFIGLWVGQKFFAGSTFNLLMGLGIIIYAYAYASGQVLFAANIIKGPALAEFAQNILRLVLLIVLLKVFGIIGVPISTIVASVIIVLAYVHKRISSLLKVTLIELKRTMIWSVLIGTVLGLAGTQLIQIDTWPGLILGAAVIILINGTMLAVADVSFRSFVASGISRISFQRKNS